MESTRQQKVSKLIQKDLADLFLNDLKDLFPRGLMVTITKVRVSPDLGNAKVYLSLFPSTNAEKIVNQLELSNSEVRRRLGNRVRNQLRVVPNLSFYFDDSLDYLDRIDSLLK